MNTQSKVQYFKMLQDSRAQMMKDMEFNEILGKRRRELEERNVVGKRMYVVHRHAVNTNIHQN